MVALHSLVVEVFGRVLDDVFEKFIEGVGIVVFVQLLEDKREGEALVAGHIALVEPNTNGNTNGYTSAEN